MDPYIGILFTLFKSLGIVGAKTYLTCVSGKACREREKLEREFGNPKERDPLPWEITYNERLENLEELSQDIAD